MKPISGTREWAVANVNCISGCSHGCRYCFARYNAVDRFKTVSAEDWPKEIVRQKDVEKKRGKIEGTIMFPTTHDITPKTLDACTAVLTNLLKAGNRVLIVSKPHKSCIEALCKELENYREQILFRFTIGAVDGSILSYWEPNAPLFEERLDCLAHAYLNDFATSVSCEPLLDADNVVELVNRLEPFVSDSIWIGKLNNIDRRVKIETQQDRIMVEKVKAGQTDEAVRRIYDALKNRPLIRWKESYKEVLGLELATEAGLDI